MWNGSDEAFRMEEVAMFDCPPAVGRRGWSGDYRVHIGRCHPEFSGIHGGWLDSPG